MEKLNKVIDNIIPMIVNSGLPEDEAVDIAVKAILEKIGKERVKQDLVRYNLLKG